MSGDLNLKETQKEWHGSLKAYFIGFLVSLTLTIASFLLVATKALPAKYLVIIVIALACVQALCQLIFFLHVGQEPKPRWESLVLYFMALILFIVVIGSIWIINDLNLRMMMHD